MACNLVHRGVSMISDNGCGLVNGGLGLQRMPRVIRGCGKHYGRSVASVEVGNELFKVDRDLKVDRSGIRWIRINQVGGAC